MRKEYLVTIRVQFDTNDGSHDIRDYTTSIANIDYDFEKIKQKIRILKDNGEKPICLFHHVQVNYPTTLAIIDSPSFDSELELIRQDFIKEGHNKNPYPEYTLYWKVTE